MTAVADHAAEGAPDADAPAPGPPEPWFPGDPALGTGLFAGGLVLLLAYAWWLGRDLFWFSDDWDIIAFYHDGHLLQPFNGHLSILPVSVFRALFVTVGLRDYAPYRAVGLASYALLGIVLFLYARKRVTPTVAALASLGLLWFSSGQINVLFPFLMNFSLPIAAAIGMWLLLDRDTVWSDVGAAGCVAVGLACSGIGLMAVGAVGVELLWKRAPLRRWLPFVPPVLLWLAWYAKYHAPVAQPTSGGSVVTYALKEVEATFAAFAGGSTPLGYVLLVITVGVFVTAAARWHTFNARVAGALAGFVAFIVLTAYSREGIIPLIPPDTGRYLWVNAAFLIVALVDAVRGRRLHPTVVPILAVMVLAGGIVLVGTLRDFRDSVVTYKAATRTYLVATEIARDRIDGDRILPLTFIPVTVRDYLDAIDHLGSPVAGYGVDDLGPESDRAGADAWMVADEGLRLVPAAPGATADPGCAVAPAGPGGVTDVSVVAGRSVVVEAGSTDAPVRVRRLARRYPTAPLGVAPAGATRRLNLPDDDGGRAFPWHVQVRGNATVAVCR